MKIGIITLPLHTNYGGILQAYALQTILKRMGHKSYILEKKIYDIPTWKIPFIYSKRILYKLIRKKTIPIFYEISKKKENSIKRRYTNSFIKNRLYVENFYKFEHAKKLGLDAIIVGSDQIWRPLYTGESNIEDSFLKFAKGWKIKRIAYAPSFGTDYWEYPKDKTETCAKLLESFDAISVREESGIKLCKEYLKQKALHVLDPTMLLDKNDYVKLFIDCTKQSTGNLLIYVLDETNYISDYIKSFARANNLIPFRVNSKVEDATANISDKIQPPVEAWLRGFYDADFILTDSFHACVFSIIFNKQFLVFENKKRGISRIESLLKLLDIDNRIIKDNNTFINTPVNYDTILPKLNELRIMSYNFLEDAINKKS